MDEQLARETLQEVSGLTERIQAQSRAPLAPFFIWAAATLGGGILHLADPSDAILTSYWFIAGLIAVLLTYRIYRGQAVVAARKRWGATQWVLFAVAVAVFGSSLLALVIATSLLTGVGVILVPFVIAVTGRKTSNRPLEHAGVLSIPALALTMVGAVYAAAWITGSLLVTALVTAIARRRSA